MKKRLIRYREFKSKKDLGFICNRILSTGYFSKKNTDEIEDMTGVVGIVDDIKNKINDLNRFFRSKPVDFIDDVLLEFFEGTNYKYSVKIGVYLNASIRSDNRFYNDDLFIIDQNEYNISIDKKGYLLSKLVSFINSLNDIEKRRFDSREKPQPGKSKYSWDINPVNHFKSFLKLKPVAILNIKNKNLDEWYNGDDDFIPNGWSHDEIYNNYSKENSLVKVIKQRFDNYKVFGPCTIVHNYYQDRIYTPYFFDEDGEYRMNKDDKQIIMETTMQIRLS